MTKIEFIAARRQARVLFRDVVAGADTKMRFSPATRCELVAACQPRMTAIKCEAGMAVSQALTFSMFA